MRYYTLLVMLLACLLQVSAQDVPDGEVAEPKPEPPVQRHYDGIDVSNHQKRIDWAEVAKDENVQYVYIKATEGASYVCDTYRTNLEGARRHGIKVGSYHFLRTGSSIRGQFENFKRVVKLKEQDLLPLIDVEVRQGWTNQQLRDSVKLFADLVEEYYGCVPMIYTSSSFYDNILGAMFNRYPLFIARYSKTEPSLKSGKDWIMWQFSERGRVRGIPANVDLSRFNEGRSLADIAIRPGKLGRHRRSGSELVDKNRSKPSTIEPKEAPEMSNQQKKELKKQQERERKAKERAEKMARDEQKRKDELNRKEQERAKKLHELQLREQKREEEKRQHLEQERQRKEQERLRREEKRKQEEQKAAEKANKKRQEELERIQKIEQEKAEENQRKERLLRIAQMEQDRTDSAETVKQLTEREQKRLLRQQQSKNAKTNKPKTAKPVRSSKKVNKSSADNE